MKCLQYAARLASSFRTSFPASSLELGKSYVFSFSDGDWDLCESGQGAECYGTHIGDWFVGIGGALHWNFYEKLHQCRQYCVDKGIDDRQLRREWKEGRFRYDKSRFIKYDIEGLENLNGYRFELLQKDEEIWFNVGWVKAEEFQEWEYWMALGDLC